MMQRIFFFFIGLVIGLILGQSDEERDIQPARPTPTAPPPLKPAPPPAAEQPPTAADTLTDIKGIGPSFAQALNAAGITTFAQLAKLSAADIASKVPRVTLERIEREDWVGQAKQYSTQTNRKN